MKTQVQILTALALIIQVMVSGQTQGNQVANTKNKAYVTFGEYNPKTQTSKPIQTKQAPPATVTDQNAIKNNLLVTGSISAYNKSLLVKGTAKDAKNLLAQADEMTQIEKQLRAEAAMKQGAEKAKLLQTASELNKQIEFVQIQASEINGKISIETFNFNRELFLLLIADPSVNDSYADRSEQLGWEAEQIIKLAKEMRQEAYAMPSNSGKLGTMLNAEEKENIALNKQNEAIQILNKKSDQVALK